MEGSLPGRYRIKPIDLEKPRTNNATARPIGTGCGTRKINPSISTYRKSAKLMRARRINGELLSRRICSGLSERETNSNPASVTEASATVEKKSCQF